MCCLISHPHHSPIHAPEALSALKECLYQAWEPNSWPLAFLPGEQAVLMMADMSLSLLQGAEISTLTN